MKSGAAICESCGGRNLRRARLQGGLDWARLFFGSYPFRCRDCQHRFYANVLLWSQWAYAKCPRCLRSELATWSRRHYNPGLLANFLITFGAHKYRCPSCRCNFISFRPALAETKESDAGGGGSERVAASSTSPDGI